MPCEANYSTQKQFDELFEFIELQQPRAEAFSCLQNENHGTNYTPTEVFASNNTVAQQLEGYLPNKKVQKTSLSLQLNHYGEDMVMFSK